MADDRDEVLSVNGRYYDAFERCDLPAMEDVWSHGDAVTCIHPGWDVRRGWRQVRGSFAVVLNNGQRLKFELGDILVDVLGDVAVVHLVERVTESSGNLLGRVAATNLFVREDGRWKMTLHHGSSIATFAEEPPAGGGEYH